MNPTPEQGRNWMKWNSTMCGRSGIVLYKSPRFIGSGFWVIRSIILSLVSVTNSIQLFSLTHPIWWIKEFELVEGSNTLDGHVLLLFPLSQWQRDLSLQASEDSIRGETFIIMMMTPSLCSSAVYIRIGVVFPFTLFHAVHNLNLYLFPPPIQSLGLGWPTTDK